LILVVEDGSGRWEARHQGQAPEIDGVVLIEEGPADLAPGRMVEVEITDTVSYDLIGSVTPT
jgi:tRNA A37 methylthiotransferase MiaB